MASVAIVIDDKNLRRKVRAYVEAFNVERLLKSIGLRMLGWITVNFENEGADVGGWKPLSPNTLAARRGGSGKILQDTGRLKQSFTPGGPDNVYDVNVGGEFVTVGTRNQVASFHEDGTAPYTIEPKGSGYPLRFMTVNGMVSAWIVQHPGLPRRQMLPPEETAKKLAVSVIDAELEKAKEASR